MNKPQNKPSRRRSPRAPNDGAAPQPPEARRTRRALSHVGGKLEVDASNADDRAVLERSLAVTADEARVMQHVHGFHSYPARLHPDTARRLIEGFTSNGGRVLDPFCGSGTTLVEARLSNRSAFGSDLNPLAIELSWLKTLGPPPSFSDALLGTAEAIAEQAEDRRARKAGPLQRYPERDRELFPIHVLLELDSLRAGIQALPAGDTRRALLLVLSSLLTKMSTQKGDTSGERGPRRVRSGFTIQSFVAKTRELKRRLDAFTRALPEGAPAVALRTSDARELRAVREHSVHLVVSSPPYPGVYDYHAHHETRLRWLGLSARQMVQRELGSRRSLGELDADAAVRRWLDDFGACLQSFARCLRPDGTIALVMADSAVSGRAIYADDVARRLAPDAGLTLVGRASQPRPIFHGPSQRAFKRRARSEHVLLLRRVRRRAAG